MRSAQLLWLNTKTHEVYWFQSNKCYSSDKQLSILSCISSRITTGIQVVRYYQVDYNWYNEPFAVSQYKVLILRHAWLNLWDKRMTTGRINQVNIFTHDTNTLTSLSTHLHHIYILLPHPCFYTQTWKIGTYDEWYVYLHPPFIDSWKKKTNKYHTHFILTHHEWFQYKRYDILAFFLYDSLPE